MSGAGEFGIDLFYSLKKTEQEAIDSLHYAALTFPEFLSLKCIPIANDNSGGQVVIDENGQLFFWDHETIIEPVNLYPLGDSIAAFVESLTEEPVEPTSGDVALFNDGTKEDILKMVDRIDINAPFEHDQSLLQRAALVQKNWLVEVLINKGANLQGSLEKAMVNNNLDGFKLLLKSGADVNATNEDGDSLLIQTIIEAKPAFAKALLNYHVDTDYKDGFDQTALEVARMKVGQGEKELEEIVELLS